MFCRSCLVRFLKRGKIYIFFASYYDMRNLEKKVKKKHLVMKACIFSGIVVGLYLLVHRDSKREKNFNQEIKNCILAKDSFADEEWINLNYFVNKNENRVLYVRGEGRVYEVWKSNLGRDIFGVPVYNVDSVKVFEPVLTDR